MRQHLLGAAAALLMAACAAPALAEPPPLEAYGKLPAVERVSLSESGNLIAALGTADGNQRLRVFDTDGKHILTLPIGVQKVRGVQWVGDEFVLVTLESTQRMPMGFLGHQGNFWVTLIVDLQAKAFRWALPDQHGEPRVLQGEYGVRKINGRWCAYLQAYDSAYAPPNLYRVDLATGQGAVDHVNGANGYWENWVLDEDGHVVASDQYDGDTGEWRLLSDNGKVLMQRKTPISTASLEGFGRTRDHVLVEIMTDAGWIYEEVSLADGSTTDLGEAETSNGAYHDHSGLLIGLSSNHGVAHFFDPKLQARYNGMSKFFSGYHVTVWGHTDDLGRMLVETDGGDDSGTFWTVDIAGGKGAANFAQAYPLVTDKDVGPTRMFDYKASDGLAMDGLLTLPPGREAKNLPVVILPHGGPIVGGDHVGFDWWAQALASRGYAVFQPNYRGTDGYGKAFRDAANGEWGGKMQTDLSDGMAALAAQGIVDSKRACIVGGSYGGYAALAGVTLQHGVYRCAVAVAPVTDLKALIQWENDTHGYGEIARWWHHLMDKSSNPSILRDVSPALQAARADAPILLIHGDSDTTVPIAQSQEMERALKAAGKPVEFIVLKGDDHHLSFGTTRLQMIEATVGFVEKYNPPN